LSIRPSKKETLSAKTYQGVRGRISYPDGLVMDRILSHCHVLRVRRGDRVVDIAAHELRVGAHRFDHILDNVGQALGARANLFVVSQSILPLPLLVPLSFFWESRGSKPYLILRKHK